ncbi:MAG: endonuclease/exonuclease/phosphatase family protein [Deltaproteobacteria bacterium]|nr:endonuclease/exonuclease/phosphatase family protein [Deltaproteobacteria bacterium]
MLRIVPIGIGTVLFLLGTGLFYAARPAQPAPRHRIVQIVDTPTAHVEPPSALTIVTYNLGYASGRKNNRGDVLTAAEVRENLDQAIRQLRLLRPDIVALQEVDLDATRTFGIDQSTYLAKALGLPYLATAITWNKRYVPWPYWPPSRHFGRLVSGQAVLSRYPIRTQRVHRFAKPATNPVWYNWFYLDRLAQRVDIALGSRQATLWNVHLEAFDASTRTVQLAQLAALVHDDIVTNGLVWVGGDFNTAALASFALSAGVRSATALPIATYPSWEPRVALDHLFAIPQLVSQEGGTLPTLACSDHLPIWRRYHLPRSGRETTRTPLGGVK